MIWGINIAPYHLQRLMECLLTLVKNKTKTKCNTYVYLDDVVITAQKSEQQEIVSFYDDLLAFLTSIGVVVNLKKSSAKPETEVHWLGFLLSANRLRADPEKQ